MAADLRETMKMKWLYSISILLLICLEAYSDDYFDDSPVISLNLDIKSLTVSSAFESPQPSGTTYYFKGQDVESRIDNSFVNDNGERWVCIGWEGTGSVPLEGFSSQLSFQINEDSTLSWKWELPPSWKNIIHYLLDRIDLTLQEREDLDANKDGTIDISDTIKLHPTPTPTPIGLGLELVDIPAGSFEMGAKNDGLGQWTFSHMEPVHTVTFDFGFSISKYEITQKQWQYVMGTNPAVDEYGKGDSLPVYNVSWEGCQAFVNKLNTMGMGTFRLPSEAEWEYACRGPATNPHRYSHFSFGDSDCLPATADSCNLNQYAWWKGNNGSAGSASYGVKEIGLKEPNPWGLYDMHGNVAEWCQDTKHPDYEGAPTDGSAWETYGEDRRIFRGGSWGYYPRNCQSAFRNNLNQTDKSQYVGFRIVRVSP